MSEATFRTRMSSVQTRSAEYPAKPMKSPTTGCARGDITRPWMVMHAASRVFLRVTGRYDRLHHRLECLPLSLALGSHRGLRMVGELDERGLAGLEDPRRLHRVLDLGAAADALDMRCAQVCAPARMTNVG